MQWSSCKIGSKMAARNDPNFSRVERTFTELVSLTDELTLVGGCAAGLLITDPAAPAVRPTLDVDLVVESASYAEYNKFGVQLNALGFRQGTVHGDPICRWRKEDLILDVMSLDESVLGFGSHWYRSAIGHRPSAGLSTAQRASRPPHRCAAFFGNQTCRIRIARGRRLSWKPRS